MERQMASLLYTCPETGQQAPTGIQIDAKSLRRAWSKKLKVQCSCCGNTHQFLVRETYIESALQDVVGPRYLTRPSMPLHTNSRANPGRHPRGPRPREPWPSASKP
jgi:hypothetical protein